MASKQFNDYPLRAGNGEYNNSTDVFKIAWLSDVYSTIDIDTVNPKLADFTQVTGGNFSAATTLSSVTWVRSGTVSTLDYADLATILKNASNPTDLRTALIYNDTSTNDDGYKVVDLTGGTDTAIDVINNDFDYAVNAGGSVTGTVG